MYQPGEGTCFEVVFIQIVADMTQTAFWTYFGILNILTDTSLIVLPLMIIWKLQMNLKSKISIACCFGARIM